MKAFISKGCWQTGRLVFVCVVCFFGGQLNLGLSIETNANSQSNETIQANDAGKERKIDRAWPSSYTPRPVGADELKEKRGVVEDRLRTAVLAGTGNPKLLKDMREVLNRPWDEAGVKYFGDLLLSPSNKAAETDTLRYNNIEWREIATLLAYVATTHRDQAVGKCAAEEFDRALAWILETPGYRLYWNFAMDAIRDYGSTDLLTPTFWRGFEGGQSCSSAFAVADAAVLTKLKAYQQQNPDLCFPYRRTISRIEGELNDPNQTRNGNIGIVLWKAKIPIPEHRYTGETKNAEGTNSVEVAK